jgi:hypothetical protein
MNIKFVLISTIFLHVCNGAILSDKSAIRNENEFKESLKTNQNSQEKLPENIKIVELRTIRTTRRTTQRTTIRTIAPPSFSTTTIRFIPPPQTTRNPNSNYTTTLPPIFPPPLMSSTPSYNPPVNQQTTPGAAASHKNFSKLFVVTFVLTILTRNIY